MPDELPFLDQKFDLIVLLDVLEHIEDDKQSLIELSKLLNPNGKILITVPAMQWLWSKHDVNHHHYRRYTKSSLQEVAKSADLLVVSNNYFNFILFPLAVIKRFSDRWMNRENESVEKTPPKIINRVFCILFGLERHIVTRISMPVGLSLCMVLSKET